jgi:uncharacterized membrane protein
MTQKTSLAVVPCFPRVLRAKSLNPKFKSPMETTFFLSSIVMLRILALLGLAVARHESRKWRAIWTAGLVIAIVCGALEVVASVTP